MNAYTKVILLLILICISIALQLLEWNNISQSVRFSGPSESGRRIDFSKRHCFIDPLLLENTTSLQKSSSVIFDIEAECRAMDNEAIDSCSIPNVVHFVWYSGDSFRYDQYLSIRSIYNALKPDVMYVHGRELPKGNPFFDRAVHELGLKPVKSRVVDAVFGRPVAIIEHKSDIVRLESLIRFGGMYFDLDIIAIKPFLHLFSKNETVLPSQNGNGLNNGIILAKRCSRFMLSWYKTFERAYDDNCWSCDSVNRPQELANQNVPGIHVDRKYLKSDWPEAGNIMFSKDKNPAFWDDAVAVHTFIRGHPEFLSLSESQVIELDNKYGQIARNILSDKVGF